MFGDPATLCLGQSAAQVLAPDRRCQWFLLRPSVWTTLCLVPSHQTVMPGGGGSTTVLPWSTRPVVGASFHTACLAPRNGCSGCGVGARRLRWRRREHSRVRPPSEACQQAVTQQVKAGYVAMDRMSRFAGAGPWFACQDHVDACCKQLNMHSITRFRWLVLTFKCKAWPPRVGRSIQVCGYF